MAISTNMALCNYALSKIGHDDINIDPTSGTASNPEERRIVNLYEAERDALLAAHPWNFAMRRINIDVDDYTGSISAATQANPVVLTASLKLYSSPYLWGVGDGVYVWDVSGMTDINEELFCIGAISAVPPAEGDYSISLYKQNRVTTLDGSAYSAYASGGYIRRAPLSEFTYLFDLPSDCLQFWEVIGSDALWEFEENKIATDLDEFEARYIAQITTVTVYHPLFIECFATKLAAELTVALQTSIKKEHLLSEFQAYLSKAYRMNAIEKQLKDKGRILSSSQDTGWQKAGR